MTTTKPEAGAVHRGRLLADTLRAIRLLRAGRYTADDLAAELGVLRRTAYRILTALHGAGIEVERQREGQVVYLQIRRAALMRALGL